MSEGLKREVPAPEMRGGGPIDCRSVHRVLVRATNWVGDMVMCLPALEALRENFPSARITVLALPWVSALLQGHPAVDDLLVLRKSGAFAADAAARIRCAGAVRSGGFDLAVLFQNAFEAALLAFLGGVPRRLGYNTDGRGPLLTHRVVREPAVLEVHQVEYYLAILKAAGWAAESREPRLFLADADAEAAAGWFEREGIGADAPVVGLSPGAMYGSAKRWPAERFAAVGDLAARLWGAKVLIFGSGRESAICQQVAATMQRPSIDLCGRTSLGAAVGLIGRCNAFVTNDSGLMHIAAALGVPTLAVFGSTDPQATGPRGARTAMVRHPVECAPCLEPDCPEGHHGCMLSIEPAEVWRALETLTGRA